MERATPPRTLAQACLVAARAVVSEAVAFTLAVGLRARCAPAHCARGRNAMCARTARCTRACARCRCGIDRSLAPAPRRPMANTGWVYGGCRERAQALLQPDPALGCGKGLHVGWDVTDRPNPVPSDRTVIAFGCGCIGCLELPSRATVGPVAALWQNVVLHLHWLRLHPPAQRPPSEPGRQPAWVRHAHSLALPN